MIFQNPQGHSHQQILNHLEQGFNRYLDIRNLSNEYDYSIDKHNHILFQRKTNGTVAIRIMRINDIEIEVLTYDDQLRSYLMPQLEIYLEAINIK